ncbi:MAG: mechanosensitive ion channel domain-containing protein [Pseudomonadota bacterium]
MDTNNIKNITEITDFLKFDKLVYFFLGIILLIFISKGLRKLGESLHNKFPAKRLVILQVMTISIFSIYILGAIVLFYGVINPSREMMLAIGGSAAVAIGFSLKDIVASIISGLILLFDKPFQVGDRVSFGNYYGEIKSIGLRAVRLCTLDDSLVTIPNSRFINDTVASSNAGALDMMVVVNFHVALDTKLDLAKKLIYEIIVTSKYAYLKKTVTITIDEVEIAERLAIKLTAKAYVLDVKYEKAFQSDIVLRVSEEFKENNIKRPTVN